MFVLLFVWVIFICRGQAFQTPTLLAGLSNGMRTVGVIAHVADLRERIPNKLIVTRTPTGSTVRAEIL